MRKYYIGVWLHVLLMALITVDSSQVYAGGFETKGLGSRQLSMGGATLGLADDWSAFYWNPAGLAYLKGSELAIEGHVMFIHQESNQSLRNINLFEFNSQSNQVRSQNFLKGDSIKFYEHEPDFYGNQNIDSILPTPIIAWYMNFGDFTVATGLYGSSGGGISWKDELTGFKGKDVLSSQIDLAFFTLNLPLAFGYKFNDKFSVGANVSFVYGYSSNEVTKNYVSREEDTEDKDFLFKSQSTGYGVSVSLGALYKFNRKFSMGAVAFAPYTVYGEGESQFKSFVDEKSKSETESTQPFKTGLGVAYQPNQHLKFALDGYYVMHSMVGVKTTYAEEGLLLSNNKITWGMEDTFMARFGAEYTDLGPFAVRAGFIYDPSPFKDERASLSTPRYTDVYVPTCGFGFATKNFRIDMAYQFTISPSRRVDYDDAYSYENPPESKPDYIEISGQTHIFTLTGIYHF